MQRKVFRGVGAVIARPITDRKFHVVSQMKMEQTLTFDHDRRIEVDLDLMPSVASWDQVKVDDRGIDKHRNPLSGGMAPNLLNGYHITSIGGYRGYTVEVIVYNCHESIAR